MKKLISVISILIVTAIVCIIITPTTKANARSNSTYIYTEKVPDNIIEYSKHNFKNHLNSAVDGISDYILGNPFVCYSYDTVSLHPSNAYCFLVYDQYNKVCGTYEISFNALSNEFYSSYNRGLMGNIINVNTNDAFFVVCDDSLNFRALNSEELVLIEQSNIANRKEGDTESEDPINGKIYSNKNTLLNAAKGLISNKDVFIENTVDANCVKYNCNASNNKLPYASSQKILTLSAFNQYDFNWCAYCTTASIINYVRSAMLDPSIVCRAINGSIVNEGCTPDEVRSYANRDWNFDTYITYGPYSFNEIKYQIDNDAPIYHSWKRTDSSGDVYKHGTALSGYSDSSAGRYYYFTNSWSGYNLFSVSVNTATNTYSWVYGSRTYFYNAVVYNWR